MRECNVEIVLASPQRKCMGRMNVLLLNVLRLTLLARSAALTAA